MTAPEHFAAIGWQLINNLKPTDNPKPEENPMTTNAQPLDLDAIQQRSNLATPGPWIVDYDTCDCEPDYGCNHGQFAIAFGPFSYFDTRSGEDGTADAAFIAAARTDVPALVAEVERLRAAYAELGRVFDATLAVSRSNRRHAEALGAITEAAYGFADELDGYCSPHGVSGMYAQRLRERLNAAKPAANGEVTA